MIREAFALSCGLVIGVIAESAPVRAVRRWLIRIELQLTCHEIAGTYDDIADACFEGDFPLVETLNDFHTDLCNHRDHLREQLAVLS